MLLLFELTNERLTRFAPIAAATPSKSAHALISSTPHLEPIALPDNLLRDSTYISTVMPSTDTSTNTKSTATARSSDCKVQVDSGPPDSLHPIPMIEARTCCVEERNTRFLSEFQSFQLLSYCVFTNKIHCRYNLMDSDFNENAANVETAFVSNSRKNQNINQY